MRAVGFLDTEKGIAELGKKARGGKLTIEDMAGLDLSPCTSSLLSPWVHAWWTDAVYDCSNGGVFGSLFGTPIINLPASLAMYAMKYKPVVVNGRLSFVRPWFVALTYNHRLMVGREAVSFLA